MAIREIHIANSKRRDAAVAFDMRLEKREIRTVLSNGAEKRNVRILKSTVDMDGQALLERFGSWEGVAEAITDSDPELNMELTGKKLKRVRRLWIDSQENIAYRVNLYRTIFNPDGSERERRDVNKLPSNVNSEYPLVWTGKMFPRREAVRQFVFTRSYQLHHINGATFDFLYAMAKELDEQDSMALIGGGKRGSDPILLSRGGQPYRGFLEGRVEADRYMLILHLTDMELKIPQP